jgi:hypothetical protein
VRFLVLGTGHPLIPPLASRSVRALARRDVTILLYFFYFAG